MEFNKSENEIKKNLKLKICPASHIPISYAYSLEIVSCGIVA